MYNFKTSKGGGYISFKTTKKRKKDRETVEIEGRRRGKMVGEEMRGKERVREGWGGKEKEGETWRNRDKVELKGGRERKRMK